MIGELKNSGSELSSTLVPGLIDAKRLVKRREVSMRCILGKCDAEQDR
jgi:hypothetical protein